MKEPLELVVKGREDTLVALACPECGTVFPLDARERVGLGCCHARKYVCECGAECDSPYNACPLCRHNRKVKQEQEQFEKAEKLALEKYDGPVFWADEEGLPEGSGDCGEGYFSDVSALLDYCEDECLDVPKYVYCTSKQEMSIDAQDIIENALSAFCESAHERVDADWLQKLIDWWVANQKLESFEQDTGRVVLIDPALHAVEE